MIPNIEEARKIMSQIKKIHEGSEVPLGSRAA